LLTVLGITGPIFLIIAMGYTAVRRGLLASLDTRAPGVFVIDFALPALLFKALSGRSFGALLNLDLLLAYTLGSLAVVALVIASACLVQRRGLQAASLLAMGMTLSNSAFIGFPIAEQLIGPARQRHAGGLCHRREFNHGAAPHRAGGTGQENEQPLGADAPGDLHAPLAESPDLVDARGRKLFRPGLAGAATVHARD
jgi:hypothetical protein